MKFPVVNVALFVSVLPLAACGGSSDSTEVNRTKPVVDYADYDSQSQALHATWDAISFTDPSTLPTNGDATYLGVIRLDVEKGGGEISMAGDLRLQVSFSKDRISGNAKSFVDETNIAYAGNLKLSNGFIDRTADTTVNYTFQSDLNGTLSGGGDELDISADLSGDFRGLEWGSSSGLIQGSADGSSGAGYVFGEFIAEQ